MITRASPDSSAPTFVFAGGGTGGHLYPAIAIMEALKARCPEARFVFFGTQRRIDQHILGELQCEFIAQDLPAISWKLWKMVKAALRYRAACSAAQRRFLALHPAVVIGTGGLASVPPVRMASRMGIPTAIFNPDTVPGKANRLLAKQVQNVFVQFEDSVAQFPANTKVTVTGCPVRQAFYSAIRDTGIKTFNLDPTRKTLLVTGASQGARTVNEAMIANADFFAARPEWQVLHLTGVTDYEMVVEGYRKCGAAVSVVAYTHDMAEAMAAADLIVSRAGASTLAEIIAVGRASILMPYPFHKDQHQLVNARCVERVGGARIVRDAIAAEKNGPALRAALDDLMTADDVRGRMAAAARSVGGGRPAETIAARLLEMCDWRGYEVGDSAGHTTACCASSGVAACR